MPFPPAPSITPPEPGLQRYGLFRVASGPLDMPAHGEGSGVRYVPPACGDSYAVGIDCPAPEELPDPDGDNAEISTGVFSVRSALECSAVGVTEAEYRTRLLRRLESSEQATVERAFATGLDYDGGSLGALSLDGAAEEVAPPVRLGRPPIRRRRSAPGIRCWVRVPGHPARSRGRRAVRRGRRAGRRGRPVPAHPDRRALVVRQLPRRRAVHLRPGDDLARARPGCDQCVRQREQHPAVGR